MKKLVPVLLLLLLFSCSSKSEDESPKIYNPPSSLTVNDISPSSAIISWIANEESIGYQIEYGLDGFNQGEGDIITTTNSSHQINNLSEATNYHYYIRTNYGNGNYSNWVGPNNFTTSTTPINCNPPVPFLMLSLSSSSKKLSWYDAPEADSYTIEYGIGGFTIGNGQTINTSETSAVIDYVNAVGNHQLYIKSNCQDDASSDWVGPLNFFTNGSDCGPSNLTIVPVGNGSIYLNWGVTWTTNHHPNSWIIEYGPTGFQLGNGKTITTPDSSLGYILDDLIPLTEYEFYLKGNCDNNGTGLFTGFTTYTTLATCATPTNYNIAYGSQCSLKVQWSANYFETNWDVEYGNTGFTLGEGTTINTSNRPLTIDGLTSNTTYDIYIRTNCGPDGYSEYVGPITETTDDIRFIGEYLYESVIDGKHGPVFGAPHIVTLNEISDTEREMSVIYAESLGQGNLPFNFKFGLNCNGKIIIQPNQDTALNCGSDTVQMGPRQSSVLPTYNVYQDEEIIITFTEYSNYQELDCPDDYGYEVSIKLTKQ